MYTTWEVTKCEGCGKITIVEVGQEISFWCDECLEKKIKETTSKLYENYVSGYDCLDEGEL